MRRSGGPLGLSIIGGSDHSCVPFGTGEQVRQGQQGETVIFYKGQACVLIRLENIMHIVCFVKS